MDRTYIVSIRTQNNNEKETYTNKEFSTIDEARAYMHEEYLWIKAADGADGKTYNQDNVDNIDDNHSTEFFLETNTGDVREGDILSANTSLGMYSKVR